MGRCPLTHPQAGASHQCDPEADQDHTKHGLWKAVSNLDGEPTFPYLSAHNKVAESRGSGQSRALTQSEADDLLMHIHERTK